MIGAQQAISSNHLVSSLPGEPVDAANMVAEASSREDEIKVLALLSDITEMEISISDVNSKLFEIQELRHQTSTATTSPPPAGGSSTQEATQVEFQLTVVDATIEHISISLTSLSSRIPAVAEGEPSSPSAKVVAQRYQDLSSDYSSMLRDVDTLKAELKEDSWLSVFRIAAAQSENMMSSLEKAVSNARDFLVGIQRTKQRDSGDYRGALSRSPADEATTLKDFEALLSNYEAKKKYYRPGVEKTLSILDRGVRERVTKNGETLRRHSDMLSRYRALTERMDRVEADLVAAHVFLVARESASHRDNSLLNESASGSSIPTGVPISSNINRSDVLQTLPSPTSRRSSLISLPRSVSPLNRALKGIANGLMGTSSTIFGHQSSSSISSKATASSPQPSSTHNSLSSNKSYISNYKTDLKSSMKSPTSPPQTISSFSRTMNNMSVSSLSDVTSASSQARRTDIPVSKPRWNVSSRVDVNSQNEPVPPPRSASRNEIGPRLPSTEPGSVTPSPRHPSTYDKFDSPSPPNFNHMVQPPSPSYASKFGRATTPSHIPSLFSQHLPLSPPSPTPPSPTAYHFGRRAASPAYSDADSTTSTTYSPGRHRNKVSHIPVPVPKLPYQPSSEALNPPVIPQGGTLLSSGRESPTFLDYSRSQTPENVIRTRAAQNAFYSPSRRVAEVTPSPGRHFRPPVVSPPSSFRGGSLPRPTSRTSLRSGAMTPSATEHPPYKPKPWNTLDIEVARIVNNVPHGMLVQRVIPITTKDSPGETVAQYSFASAFSTKVLSCRLLELHKGRGSGDEKAKKVMVRVGGGWLDLEVHLCKLAL